MNTKKDMIIIKGEIKTSQIRFCKYNSHTRKMEVEFNSGKTYSYAFDNVQWLKDPKVLNPSLYRIKCGEQELFGIESIYVFYSGHNSYWHICFENGKERDYSKNELEITESCLSQQEASGVFAYLKELSGLSDIKSERSGHKMLQQKYEKLSFVGEDVALAKYLVPSAALHHKRTEEYVPIFPFGCNNSQYRAVKNAMENQISVIQGPPGTGKTQTILNIIANILMEGKTVQVVSNNNTATLNVYEKLAAPKYNLDFVVAALGKGDNKKKFINEQNTQYPDFESWKLSTDQYVVKNQIREKTLLLKSVFAKQEELAILKQEYMQLQTEYEYFKQYVDETDVTVDGIRLIKKLSANNWMKLWQECQMISETKPKIGIWFVIKGFIRYGIVDPKFFKQDIADMITAFQEMYYRMKKHEIEKSIDDCERFISQVDNGLIEELCNQSMSVLKDKLARTYRQDEVRKVFTEDDLWRHPQAVLKEYPVILSTTFSSRDSLNNEVVYDYLIMDEASQVDIVTGALALSCARNVVIVGDTKQLPNVVTENVRARADAIFDSYTVAEGYKFTKSFLQSVLEILPHVTQTLLREHYRCHPKIINFCNQKFYRGELIIMTEDKGEEDVLMVVKTNEGNHVRDHYSQRQIDVIREEVLPECLTDLEKTGIITPYKNQVRELQKEFPNILSDTVHKFQGKEKDTIVLSTVDDEISDFVDDPYLINVAVSRAKRKLVLVVSGNEQKQERNISDLISYIQYNNFEIKESKVYSVFDYLYTQYSEARSAYLKKYAKISDYDSENLMYVMLKEILKNDRYASINIALHTPVNMLIRNPELLDERECKYAMNPATHIDFLLYNRISKKPLIAIEVDGYTYHKEGTVQATRDDLKDSILEKYEIPLLRLKTNGSGEREKITNVLDSIIQ